MFYSYIKRKISSGTKISLFIPIFLRVIGLIQSITIRAGEPESEPERGAMEPANFGGTGAGAGAFLNISAEPEPESEPNFNSSGSSNGS